MDYFGLPRGFPAALFLVFLFAVLFSSACFIKHKKRTVYLYIFYNVQSTYFENNVLTLRFVGFGFGTTLKNVSSLPCVEVFRAFCSFFTPFFTLSSLNCLSPHRNLTKPSSSGSDHFNLNKSYAFSICTKIIPAYTQNYVIEMFVYNKINRGNVQIYRTCSM